MSTLVVEDVASRADASRVFQRHRNLSLKIRLPRTQHQIRRRVRSFSGFLTFYIWVVVNESIERSTTRPHLFSRRYFFYYYSSNPSTEKQTPSKDVVVIPPSDQWLSSVEPLGPPSLLMQNIQMTS